MKQLMVVCFVFICFFQQIGYTAISVWAIFLFIVKGLPAMKSLGTTVLTSAEHLLDPLVDNHQSSNNLPLC